MPHRQPAPGHAANRLGRRGASLLILAGVYLLIGASILIADPEPDSSEVVIYQMLPAPARAGIWWAAAGGAAWAATRRGPGRDGAGFVVVMVPLLIRALSHLWSSASWLLSWIGQEPQIGTPHGWMTAAVWLGFAGLIVVISGWAEVPHGYAPPEQEEGGEGP